MVRRRKTRPAPASWRVIQCAARASGGVTPVRDFLPLAPKEVRAFLWVALHDGGTAQALALFFDGVARYWARLERHGRGACLRWPDLHPGRAAGVLGHIKWCGTSMTPLRIAWLISRGRFPPPRRRIQQRCGHRDCVAPDHLMLQHLRRSRARRLAARRPRAAT
jgi:hypothetical protein